MSRLPALAVLIVVAHLSTSLVLGASPRGSLASNLLQIAAGVTAALASVGAARRSGPFARRFWGLVSMALWIWCAGQATYAYAENWALKSVTSPSWTHFLFRVYGAPLLMALLIRRDDEITGSPDWQRVLDFAQVGILFMFFYFDMYFVPGEAWEGITGPGLWGFFDLTDVENWLLALAFLGRARWSRHSEERALSLRMCLYLFAYAVGSTFSNYRYAFHPYRTGEWVDVLFSAALGLATFIAGTWRSEGASLASTPDRSFSVNLVPASLPVLTLVLALPVARKDPGVAFTAVFGSAACFGARLILTLQRRQTLMEALRASEARYSNLVRLAPDAILVHTAGRISFANPAAARLLGFSSPTEVVGRDLTDFLGTEQRDELTAQIDRIGPQPLNRRLILTRANGTRVTFDAVGMSFTRAPGESGPPTRLVIGRDATEREKIEAERENLIRELEAKNSELERFTYTVSHDLRSPLVTVTGFLAHVEEAAARGDMEAVRNDLDRVRRAAGKMDRLLSDLLELSRVGHVLSTPQAVPFEALAREAVELIEGRLKEKSVSVEIDARLPVVFGDRSRLLEVVQNLLDNAAKFMVAPNSRRIRIGARKDAGETVLFVEDNGPGIDPAHHERIFRLFDKLDPKAEGTGVGLALVKRIIELHRGRIWVESAGGEGTTFCFTLPGVPEILKA